MKDFNIDEGFEFNDKDYRVFELIGRNIALKEAAVLYKKKAEMADAEALAWKNAYEILRDNKYNRTGERDINEEPILISDIVRRYDAIGRVIFEGEVDYGEFKYEKEGRTTLLKGYFIKPRSNVLLASSDEIKGIPLSCYGFFGEDKERNEIIGSGGETFEEEDRRKHKR